MNNAQTFLRQDLLYLRCILTEAINLHPCQTPEDSLKQVALRDYLIWLTIDAMQYEELACRLVPTLAKLQEEFHANAEYNRTQDVDPTAQAFFEGFLYSLEQAISFRYGVDLLIDEEINRGEFLESWERTQERIGL